MGDGHLRLIDMVAFPDTESASLEVVEDSGGDGGPWTAVAVAVCAATTFDRTLVRGSVSPPVDRTRTGTANCTDGTSVQGGFAGGTAVDATDPPGLSSITEGSDGTWSITVFDDLGTPDSNWISISEPLCFAG